MKPSLEYISMFDKLLSNKNKDCHIYIFTRSLNSILLKRNNVLDIGENETCFVLEQADIISFIIFEIIKNEQ